MTLKYGMFSPRMPVAPTPSSSVPIEDISCPPELAYACYENASVPVLRGSIWWFYCFSLFSFPIWLDCDFNLEQKNNLVRWGAFSLVSQYLIISREPSPRIENLLEYSDFYTQINIRFVSSLLFSLTPSKANKQEEKLYLFSQKRGM